MIDEQCIPDDIETLEEQIQIRIDLQRQMVGNLYPLILEDQVHRLRERLAWLKQ